MKREKGGTESGSRVFNHIPGGTNVLYMDGHVGFVRHDRCGKAPCNAGTLATLGG